MHYDCPFYRFCARERPWTGQGEVQASHLGSRHGAVDEGVILPERDKWEGFEEGCIHVVDRDDTLVGFNSEVPS